MSKIYIYTHTDCGKCQLIDKMIKYLKLDNMFELIDQNSAVILEITPTFKFYYPCFFYIQKNKKILLDGNKIMNKIFQNSSLLEDENFKKFLITEKI